MVACCSLVPIGSTHSLPCISAEAEVFVVDASCQVNLRFVFVNNSKSAKSEEGGAGGEGGGGGGDGSGGSGDDDGSCKSAKFILPMDEAAAVCGFSAHIGDRVIQGRVQEKKQARRTYNRALKQGHAASLLEEITDDTFTIDIANIPASSTVRINVEYVSSLKSEGDALRFLLPTTYLPRYTPVGSLEPTAGGINYTTECVTQGISVTMVAIMGSRIVGMESVTHGLEVELEGRRGKAKVQQGKLGDETGDVVLLIRCEHPHQPRVIVERSTEDNTHAMMVTLCPRFELDDRKCEFVFVVDRSGSMSGSQIAGAREVLQLLLRSLPPNCFFNIVGFGSSFEMLFPKSVAYSPHTLRTASEHAAALQANLGGTEILAPLQALSAHKPERGYARQVFVITDGAVSNVNGVIAFVRGEQEARFFSLGIGGSVSHALVEGIARAGNGTACFVNHGERMQSKVVQQLKQAMQPALTNVTVDWGVAAGGGGGGGSLLGFVKKSAVVSAPHSPPPAFNGSVLTVRCILDGEMPLPAEVRVQAESPDGPLSVVLAVDHEEVTTGMAVHRMAARTMIRDLYEGTGVTQGGTAEVVKARIVELGVKYSLASQHTSFVAVEGQDADEAAADDEYDEEKEVTLIATSITPQSFQLTCGVQRHSSLMDIGMETSVELASCMMPLKGKRRSSGGFTSAVGSLFSAAASKLGQVKQSLSVRSRFNDDETRCASVMAAKEKPQEVDESNGEAPEDHAGKRSQDMGYCPYDDEGFARVNADIPKRSLMTSHAGEEVGVQTSITLSAPKDTTVASSTNASKAVVASPTSQLASLVKLQQFDGSFLLCQALADVVGVALDVLRSKAPSGDNEVAWATAIAVAFMRTKLGKLAEEWELMEKKAVQMLEGKGAAGMIGAAMAVLTE